MKKIFTLLVVAVLLISSVFAFAACDQQGTDTRETLVVGMECAYAPYNWSQPDASNGAVPIDGTNLFANGYDIKIAKIIAAALDRNLVVKMMDWDALIPAIGTGDIDLIIAGMSPTSERKEIIDFTDNYLYSNLVIVVRKDSALANATSLADFANKNIVAQRDTFHEEALLQITGIPTNASDPTVPHDDYRKPDFSAMILALTANSIDGYIAEESGAIADCSAVSSFTYIPLVNNGTGFTITDEADVSLAVGLAKGSLLREVINEILSGISADLRNTLMVNAIEQYAQFADG